MALDRHEWERLLAEDASFAAALGQATSPEDAVRIAREYGLDVTVADIAQGQGELAEPDLEGVSGGTIGSTQQCVTPQAPPTYGCATYLVPGVPHC